MPTTKRALSMRTISTLALLGIAASPARALGQRATAEVSGRVTGGAGVPLAGAEVTVLGDTLAATTDSGGRFRLAGLAAGERALVARRVGFRSATTTLVLRPGERREGVEIRLEPLPVPLDTVRTEAAAEQENLRRSGFLRRKALGFGHFVTRAEIEQSRATDAWDVLRQLPFVEVTQPRLGRSVVTLRGGSCRPRIYLDGAPAAGLDALPASFIDGIEVYRHAAEVPAEYGGGQACGAILIWTR